MGKSIERLRRVYLETQKLRENLIKRLSDILEIAQEEMEYADATTKPEWLRLIGYISAVLNTVMKSYDECVIEKQLKLLDEMIEKAKGLDEEKRKISLDPAV